MEQSRLVAALEAAVGRSQLYVSAACAIFAAGSVEDFTLDSALPVLKVEPGGLSKNHGPEESAADEQ